MKDVMEIDDDYPMPLGPDLFPGLTAGVSTV